MECKSKNWGKKYVALNAVKWGEKNKLQCLGNVSVGGTQRQEGVYKICEEEKTSNI